MSSLGKRWGAVPLGRKVLYLSGGVVMFLLLVASIVGVFWNSAPVSAPTPGKPDRSETARPVEPGEGEAGARGRVSVGEYSFEVDENGMVVMPVTTDPAEAAAGAAAVAFSVDTSKLGRQAFFDEAISRMTQPSPEYVGPVGQVDTVWMTNDSDVFWEFYDDDQVWAHSVEPSKLLHSVVKRCGFVQPGVDCAWWTLANAATYDDESRLGWVWRGTPSLVMNETEMRAWDEKSVRDFHDWAGADLTPDAPGASLTRWWVLSEVSHSLAADNDTYRGEWAEERPAKFFIWCDAPEDGGLCGVMSISFFGPSAKFDFPALWPKG